MRAFPFLAEPRSTLSHSRTSLNTAIYLYTCIGTRDSARTRILGETTNLLVVS
jgi:hypothetical protein